MGESSDIFYHDAATPSAPANPTQAPQPAGFGGGVSGSLSGKFSSNHLPVYAMIAIFGIALVALHFA